DGAGQLEVARLHAVDVDDRHDAADHDRKLAEAGVGEVFRLERLVRGAEIDGRRLDLGDAAAGADRLVVDLVAGLLAERGRPFRRYGIDERRAGTGDVDGSRRAGGERQRRGGGQHRQRKTKTIEHGNLRLR